MDRQAEQARQEAQWSAWMRAAQGGDAACYEQLLRSVSPLVRTLARRYCRGPAQAEDVVQDVLLTVHRVRHTWDPHRPFTPWLAAIAARRGIDRLRREARVSRFEVNDDLAIETFVQHEANTESGALRAAEEVGPLLAALPERQRRALEAVKLRGLSLVEAASELGQSVAALKVNVHRGIQKLRKQVADEAANDSDR